MTLKLRIFVTFLLAAAALAAATPARAQNDSVQFFNDIHVTPESPLHDAVCFFCSVRVDGKVTGDVAVFFGDVHLAGDAQHDVVNFFGNIIAEDNSSIDEDLLSVFGTVHLGNHVTIGRDMTTAFGALDLAPTVTVGGKRVVEPIWIAFVPFVFLVLVIFVVFREITAARRRRIQRGY